MARLVIDTHSGERRNLSMLTTSVADVRVKEYINPYEGSYELVENAVDATLRRGVRRRAARFETASVNHNPTPSAVAAASFAAIPEHIVKLVAANIGNGHIRDDLAQETITRTIEAIGVDAWRAYDLAAWCDFGNPYYAEITRTVWRSAFGACMADGRKPSGITHSLNKDGVATVHTDSIDAMLDDGREPETETTLGKVRTARRAILRPILAAMTVGERRAVAKAAKGKPLTGGERTLLHRARAKASVLVLAGGLAYA